MQRAELQNIGMQDILRLSPILEEASIGTDFIIGEGTGSQASSSGPLLEMLHYPIRFDGYILFFVRKGKLGIDFNLRSFEMGERSLVVSVPGNIIRLTSPEDSRLLDTEVVYVVLSKDFVSGLQLNFNLAFQESQSAMDTPCITLTDEQFALAESYYKIAWQVMSSSYRNKRQIVSALLSSLSYLADDVWTESIRSGRQNHVENNSRARQIYNRFMKLVTEYHTSERGMNFYAEKMCLTPKYLSKVVKQVSGRSGPEWIDAYVILEAKNLLRYSDESIKEIVYRLNFPRASVFNKFFKLHTGMSPSEYRRS